MNILIIEDDEETAAFIASALTARGHEATVAGDGREGFELAAAHRFNAIVLDRMLPELDGLSVVALLRRKASPRRSSSSPICRASTTVSTDLKPAETTIWSSPSRSRNCWLGSWRSLAGRRSDGRRPCSKPATSKSTLSPHGAARRRGHRSAAARVPTARIFPAQRGPIVTRKMLLEKVWEFHFDPKTNIVETHISRLRAKIDRGRDAPLIQTVRGAGYMLRVPSPAP